MTDKTERILAGFTSHDDIAALMLTTHHNIQDHLALNNLVDIWRRRTALIFEGIYSQEKYFNIDLSDYVPEIITTVTEFDRIRIAPAQSSQKDSPDL